jgi:hypothetical protein
MSSLTHRSNQSTQVCLPWRAGGAEAVREGKDADLRTGLLSGAIADSTGTSLDESATAAGPVPRSAGLDVLRGLAIWIMVSRFDLPSEAAVCPPACDLILCQRCICVTGDGGRGRLWWVHRSAICLLPLLKGPERYLPRANGMQARSS